MIEDDEVKRRMWRHPNPETMGDLRRLVKTWQSGKEAVAVMRSDLDARIVEAFDEGHSYRQIKEATGLSVSTIQLILARAGLA